jgi:hypothetical protein
VSDIVLYREEVKQSTAQMGLIEQWRIFCDDIGLSLISSHHFP